jgi:hypothetical protein
MATVVDVGDKAVAIGLPGVFLREQRATRQSGVQFAAVQARFPTPCQ